MPDQKQKLQSNKKFDSYLKFSTLSFEMLAIIVLFTFSGNKIDFYFNVQKPFFTATFALLGTVLALYLAFKKILKK